MIRFLTTILCMFTVASLSFASSPVSSIVQKQFKHQMQLADASKGREVEVKHLKRALKLRPNDPKNVVIEWRIAVALSEHGDPTHGPPNPKEAIPWLKHILNTYHHMDYYTKWPAWLGSWSPDFKVPESAVLLASILNNQPGTALKRRKLLMTAMENMQKTFKRRKHDWLSEPEPQMPSPFLDNFLGGKSKLRGLRENWRKRRAKAKQGDVFGKLEMSDVKAAVREYGYTYGRQHPWQVRKAMEPIIKRFPGTPMAKVAQGHIDRAAKMENDHLTDVTDDVIKSFGKESITLDKIAVAPETSLSPMHLNKKARIVKTSAVKHGDPPGNSLWLWWAVGIVILAIITVSVFMFYRKQRSS